MKLTRLIRVGAVALVAALFYAPAARAATTFIVNSTGDGGDANTWDDVCATSTGACTLRAAIQQAEATSGADTIHFNIPGVGVHTIRPAASLPTTYGQITIDGTTQPGYSTTPLIELDGSLITEAGSYGLRPSADRSVIRGLAINRFEIGIDIRGERTVIEGNFVGTNPAGTTARPNMVNGISVLSANNVIGGPSGITRGGACLRPCNLVSGNGRVGIRIAPGATGNRVEGNLIGTDITGNAALGNGGGISQDGGVVIYDTSSNAIGNVGPILEATPRGNVISGNSGNGVIIDGYRSEGDNNVIAGNFIGLNAAGTAAVPNTLDGILIFHGSNNQIGVMSVAGGERFLNVISGNGLYGIEITGAGSVGNRVQGNLIGTDKNGMGTTTVALPNGGGISIADAVDTRIGGPATIPMNQIYGSPGSGVELSTVGAPGGPHGTIIANNVVANNGYGINISIGHDNVIGGTAAYTRNYIQNNRNAGITISGANTHHNSVLGNIIGLGIDGTTPAGNGGLGVDITYQAHDNTIGGASPEARNVISDHIEAGVMIYSEATANRVLGNFIGTNATGTSAAGNGTGVIIGDAPGNTIGGSAPGEGNLISGNTSAGVSLADTDTTGNLVQGNRIGTNASGGGALPNGMGILVRDASDNLIGGTAGLTPGGACTGACNLIAYNTGFGIGIESREGNAYANRIQGNSIFGNDFPSSGVFLGIDLGVMYGSPRGVTPNDAGDGDNGPNRLQNFPEIASATATSVDMTVTGTLNSRGRTRYRLEFFANTTCDRSGYGEGERYLGFTEVTTNNRGDASFGVLLPAVSAGQFITATATDIGRSDTSEFSLCSEVQMSTTAPIIAAMETLRSDIAKLVQAKELTRAQGKTLDRLLRSAIKAVEKGNTGAAIARLNTFNKKLNAWMKRGRVEPNVGQPLVDSADAIVDLINNPQQPPGDPVEPPGN